MTSALCVAFPARNHDRHLELVRQMGVSAKRLARPTGARFFQRRGDDRRIIGFPGESLMKEITIGSPGLQGRLHRWRRDREIEEALRGLTGFEFSRQF
jgi:hypothetical protein